MLIKIPQNNILERTYIMEILIGEFLGLSFTIEASDTSNYHLLFEEKEIVIEDHFFNLYPKDLGYIIVEAIPLKVSFAENQFTSEKDIPVLFGNEKMIIETNRITCGIDIFSSSFFMLTRWEEYVILSRDLHDRFSAKDSLAYKFNFLDRPIVNEYVELLWGMLTQLGFPETRKVQKFEFVLTHDVDFLRFYKKPKQVLRKMMGDLIKRKRPLSAMKTLTEYIQVKSNKILDPFNTFGWIMDLSESLNIKSRFYFMTGGTTTFDNHYDISEPDCIKLIEEIKSRGHIIGFHPSFDTYNDIDQWKKEKDLLEKVVGQEVNEGRQHFLRFEAPGTWNIWDENNMKTDLTLSYADKEGFRCGVCYEFSIFDFLRRVKLKVKEMPLIVMEASFMSYQQITPNEMYYKTKILSNRVRKYNGKFVYLWHNSSFNIPIWRSFQFVYENILNNHMK